MRYTEHEIIARVERLTVSRLRAWIESGCIRPENKKGVYAFTEADLARINLLCELQDNLNIQEEVIPLILSLIDQIHSLRRELRDLAHAVEQQPKTVQEKIVRSFHALKGE